MFQIAFKTIIRSPRRTAVTLFLVISGTLLIAFMRFLTYGFTQDMIANSISLDSGFVEVAAYGWNEKRSLQRALEATGDLVSNLRATRGVRETSFRLRGGGLLNFRDKTRFISILAADPIKERKITTIHKCIVTGDPLDNAEKKPEAIMGFRLARALGMKVGDEFYLVTSQFDGSVGAMKLRLRGIFNSRNSVLDSSRVNITLKSGEELFGTRMGERLFYTSIALGVDSYLDAEQIRDRLDSRYPPPEDPSGLDPGESDIFQPVVLGWRDLNPNMVGMLKIAAWKMDIFFALFIVSISFGVLNSVQMSLQERLRQFGVLLAIGTTARRLFGMVTWEIFFLLVPGVFLGTLLAAAGAQYFHYHPIELTGSMAEIYESMGYLPRWRPIVAAGEVLSALTGMIVPAFLISLFSVRRIFKLDPIRIINTI